MSIWSLLLIRLQLFKFEDRREGKWLLAPTHEEEITALVRDIASSYKELPLRLYQTSMRLQSRTKESCH